MDESLERIEAMLRDLIDLELHKTGVVSEMQRRSFHKLLVERQRVRKALAEQRWSQSKGESGDS